MVTPSKGIYNKTNVWDKVNSNFDQTLKANDIYNEILDDEIKNDIVQEN